jgi:hypothetical protein
MGNCVDTEWRDFEIVDMKVDTRQRAVDHLEALMMNTLPVAFPLVSEMPWTFPESADYKEHVHLRVNQHLGHFKHGLDLVVDRKTALDFHSHYLQVVERLLLTLSRIPSVSPNAALNPFVTKTSTTVDSAKALQKRKDIIRWFHEPPELRTTDLKTTLKDVLTFVTYLEGMGTQSVPTWLDEPDSDENLALHNDFWSMMYHLAKKLDMDKVLSIQFNLEVSRQPIVLYGSHSVSFNHLMTALLKSPYNDVAIKAAHDLVMDDVHITNKLQTLGHTYFLFYQSIYQGAHEQLLTLSSSTRKSSTEIFLVSEAQKVSHFELETRKICSNVSFKLDVLDMIERSRAILYDDLSQLYMKMDKTTFSTINDDLHCPDGIQWIFQESNICCTTKDCGFFENLELSTILFIVTIIALIFYISKNRQ